MKRVLAGLLAALLLVVAAIAAWLYTPDRSRADSEARFSRGDGDFVEAAGLRFHVRQEGPADAPVLVMIHGNGSMLQTWDGWAADLSRDHRVIRYDLAGHGLTGADPAGIYGTDRDVRQLAALLDALGVETASLIGNSLGGQIAWNYAMAFPEQVEKLVLVAPGGYPLPGVGFDQAVEPTTAQKLRPYTLKPQAVRMVLSALYGDPARVDDAAVTRYYESWRAPGVRQALLERTRQYRIQDPAARLRTIQAPTLLVWGEKDWLVSFATVPAQFQANLPDSRLVSFPGLGHMPQEEDPATTVAAVRAFLEEAP